MKVLRLPTKTGTDWWVVTHGLTLSDGRLRNLRPIHLFTLLVQTIVTDKRRAFSLGLALENKLYAVRHFLGEARRSIASWGDPIYRGDYAREYGPDQEIICTIEAYLQSIYSSLEISAQLNKCLEPSLPQGFRRQQRKYALFAFEEHPWLPRFYDLRTELSHYGSPLPVVHQGKLCVEFVSARDLEAFSQGRHEIEFTEVLSYGSQLFDLLDSWAHDRLKLVDPDTDVDSASLTGWKKPLASNKVKARELLTLLSPDGET